MREATLCRAAPSFHNLLLRSSAAGHRGALLLLCNHGWCLRRPKFTMDMTPSDIRYHRAAGSLTSSMALVIRGPSISLDRPLLYPGVGSGRGLFKVPSELAAPPPSFDPTMPAQPDLQRACHRIASCSF